MSDNTTRAYNLGRELALRNFEKTAFLGGIFNAGKFLAGMGNLGAKGSTLAKISPHYIGSPLGFGLMGAATAEEGEGMQGFTTGLIGGLAFAPGMALGARLGKRLLAPGFKGKNTQGIVRGLGFSDDAAAQISASQALNKPFKGSLERRLNAGTASKGQIDDMFSNIESASKTVSNLDDPNFLQLQNKLKAFKSLQDSGGLTPALQGQLGETYSQYAKYLYGAGKATGTAGQRRMLGGLRFAKGFGGIAGGIGGGFYADHLARGMVDTRPASYFDAKGGH